MLTKQRIYLDNNGSTSIDPAVLNIICNELSSTVGNSSSTHFFGLEQRAKLNKSRSTIATFLNVKPNEIIFTSGGTEAANMLLRGYIAENGPCHIITSDIEHSCVYSTVKYLEKSGCQVTFLKADEYGAIKPNAVKEAILPNTKLITLMAVNNETGVKTEIDAIAELAEQHKITFFVDGVALLGKEAFTIPSGVSGMWFSGHKFHAPKGSGFAFIRAKIKLTPLLIGGEQEKRRRGGTENISGAVAMAEAISLLENIQTEASKRMQKLRDKLEKSILARFPIIKVNGTGMRICNTSNLAFEGLDGESLLINLDLEGIAVSHGSACASGALEPSRILLNMGIPIELARSSLRISLSRFTTEEEIDRTIEVLSKIITKLQNK